MPDGATHLRFTGLELLKRLAALVPPAKRNLLRFPGVFAPGAKLRPFLVPAAAAPQAEEDTGAGRAGVRKEARRQQVLRLDWAGLLKRTFKHDVLLCAGCGGRRRVLAYLSPRAP